MQRSRRTLTILLSLLAAPFGITAIAAAYVLRAYLTIPVQMWAFKRYSGVGYRAIAPTLSMAVVMAGALLLLGHFVSGRIDHRGDYRLVMVSIGALVYAAALALFARGFVFRQIQDLRRLLPARFGEALRSGGARATLGQ